MTRYDKIKKMNVEEMARAIVNNGDAYIDDFCKGDCDDSLEGCPHPAECCKRWLMEGEI